MNLTRRQIMDRLGRAFRMDRQKDGWYLLMGDERVWMGWEINRAERREVDLARWLARVITTDPEKGRT